MDEDLTGWENLILLGRLLGHSRSAGRARADELLAGFGLTEAAGRQVKTYSGGMRRRLDIASSIVVTPDLMFLDEPTTGLDPRSRNQVWDVVRALVAGGTTVLLTTQYLDEADQLAARIAVIDHGRVIAEGTPGQLKASIGSGTLVVRLHDADQRARAGQMLSQVLGVPVQLESDPSALSARVDDPARAGTALTELAAAGVGVSEFSLGQPSLDAVFLALTGIRPTKKMPRPGGGCGMSTDSTTAAPARTVPSEAGLSEEALRSLLAADRRPSPAGPFSASMLFTWRALLKIKHVPEQLFDVTVFPIMFTLLFTYLFGGALAGSTQAYLQFLLPGILVQTVLMITIYTGMTLSQDITKGVFDRFRSLPIWAPAVLVGALLADAIRYALASVMCLILGLILGFRPPGGVTGVVPAVLLVLVFCFGLSWIWTLLGLLLRSPTAVQGWSMMFLFPLTFASNIFVDPATMPGWLEAFVNANPVTVLTTAVRGLMAGETDGQAVLTVLLISLGLTVVFGPMTMRLYRTRN